ncbi:MAG: substrate-binding domain-containing protein [Beijerinckiaceae bacterium]|nr:substrate-binding domain-containing protein [Beijerinckiaceae bacterium]
MARFRASAIVTSVVVSAGLLIASTFPHASSATAAEVRIIASDAVRLPMMEITSAFQKETSNQTVTTYGPFNTIEKRLAADPKADIVFWSLSELNNLVRKDAIAPDYPKVVGRVRIAVGYRTGGQRPDVSTIQKLRATIQNTSGFAYGNPASGVPTDLHIVRIFDELGLGAEMKDKGLMRDGGINVMKEVADRRVNLGFAQASEIVAFPGVSIGGFLPDALQLTTVPAAAGTKAGKANPAAVALFARIVSEPTSYIFERTGFDIRR